jgi:hypothetical protein
MEDVSSAVAIVAATMWDVLYSLTDVSSPIPRRNRPDLLKLCQADLPRWEPMQFQGVFWVCMRRNMMYNHEVGCREPVLSWMKISFMFHLQYYL